MNAMEILAIARKEKPHVKYATTDEQDCIGAWDENQGRYVPVAGLLITGEWASLPVEIFVNGKPIPRNWVEADNKQTTHERQL